ncbi:MAG: phosphoglycerate kinase [Candidatus Electryonea clarkiae]|nr:phosphoglycerate kinase [Candidatus Electryonea clarkiae]MDP8288546.1 phosphoglycerate kinase [Candidatus Electryonea clarkiae]
MFDKMTIDDVDVQGKNVLMRVDFNVPLTADFQVADDARIVKALPSIRKVLDDGGKLILMSHLGRPKGIPKREFSLAPVAEHLSGLLEKEVRLAPDTIGPEVVMQIENMKPGNAILLENVRFYNEETDNDPEFAGAIARLGDIYINDAFGTAHRAHASTEGVAHHVYPAVAGYLMQKELDYLGKALEKPKRPFWAVLGGAKISGKIDVIENLLPKVDGILLGGAMAFTFDAFEGLKVGNSFVEKDRIEMAGALLEHIENSNAKVLMPMDIVIADAFNENAGTKIVKRGEIPDGWQGLDIGPETIISYSEALRDAETVVWNGPMGVCEMEPFRKGTKALADTLVEVTARGAVTIVGGGDTAAALKTFDLVDKVTHVSTGGGASLEFLEGKTLPGVAALTDHS